MGARYPTTVLLALALATAPFVGVLGLGASADAVPAASDSPRGAAHDAVEADGDIASIATTAYETRGDAGQLAQANLDGVDPAAASLDAKSTSALLAELGVEDPLAAADTIEAAPADVRAALGTLLAAFTDYRDAAQAAFDDPDRLAAAESLAASIQGSNADPIDVDPPIVDDVIDTRNRVAEATQTLQEILADHGPLDVEIHECPTLSIDLTHTDDPYTNDCALLVDAGGQDVYHNNAGGSHIGDTECGIIDYDNHRVAAAVVDLGDGADTYGQTDDPRSCGVNGGGWAGAGFLWDEGGPDRYAAGETATNGGALYGVGYLHDGGGDDLYTAAGYAVNGGGAGGVGFLHDEAGDDTYRATSVAANGGAYTGIGLLADERGDDTYQADAKGANGGSVRGLATLLDGAGDDTYRAAHTGVNGGSEREILGFLSVIIPPSSGFALLADADGRDVYHDLSGSSGVNESTFEKGTVGMQVDVPNLPSDDQGTELDQQAPDARPHVTIGVADDEINPYHEQFHRPNLTEHPCTYLPDFPCDIEALNLTLDADSYEEALEADEDVWDSVEEGEWYWIPQTPFVAVRCQPGGSDPCIINDEFFPDPHGTETASTLLAENEDALLAYHDGRDASLDGFLHRGIPVDMFAVSQAHLDPRPLPAGTCGSVDEHELTGLYVKSTSDDFTAYPTAADCWSSAPNVVEVAGAFPDGRTVTLSNTQPELVSYYCRPTAAPDSVDETNDRNCGGGGSWSHPGGPTAAGAISKVIQAVREETGYTGNVEDGVVDPLYGDDGLTVGELRDAVNRTASYEPEGQFNPDYNFFETTQETPRDARWTAWGWGFYDSLVANATVEHLLEEEQPAKPLPIQLYMEGQEALTSTYYGDAR